MNRVLAGKAGGIWGVIPAAGVGSRMGGETPKQYLRIGRGTLLEYAAAVLLSCRELRGLVIAHHPEDSLLATLALAEDPRVRLVVGGAERADSVLAAVESLASSAADDDWVMVHDAARPCLDPAVLQPLLNELGDHPVGGILAQPLSDTVKRADAAGAIEQTLPRERLWRAQTPQVFRYRILLDALKQVAQLQLPATDEAMAVERMGYRPRLVEGPACNIKVTFPADLPLAAWYLERAGMKI